MGDNAGDNLVGGESAEEIINQVEQITHTKRGRPKTRAGTRKITKDLESGKTETIDKPWLLAQLLKVYNSRDCRASEKLRALELMAKMSGYDAQVDESERAAIADLLRDLDGTKA